MFKSPTDCERSNCTFYWAMGPNTANSQYLDVYMEGTVDGWLAVGFSLDQAMVGYDIRSFSQTHTHTYTINNIIFIKEIISMNLLALISIVAESHAQF